MNIDLGKCNVCDNEPAVGVCCVPGLPVSVAYGKNCLEADAHPWSLLVANTAIVGGLENTAEWWREMVQHTCSHLGKTIEEFNANVRQCIDEMEVFDV